MSEIHNSQNPLVSIILPIYNAGKYLKQCIESLQDQTLENIEIICILDCPTDGSDDVVREYAKTDERIVIIQNENNLHVGLSRNKGIKQARGKYIGFMDHDDYCAPTMYELLYKAAEENNADFIGCNYDIVNNQSETISSIQVENQKKSNNTRETLLSDIYKASSSTNSFAVWNKLYNLSFIKTHSIDFVDTKVISGEDILFNINFLLPLSNEKVAFVPSTLFHHRYHLNNTGITESYKKHIIEHREMLSELAQYYNLGKNHEKNLYIGDIRQAYSYWLKYCLPKFSFRNISNRFPWNICNYPHFAMHIRKYYSIYNRELTLPKNIFAFFCYCIVLIKGN